MACSVAYNPRSLRCSDNEIPQELQGHLEVKGVLQGAQMTITDPEVGYLSTLRKMGHPFGEPLKQGSNLKRYGDLSEERITT